MRAASRLAPPAPTLRITNPTDFNLFMIRAYLGNDLTTCADGGSGCDAFDLSGGSTLSEPCSSPPARPWIRPLTSS